MKYNFVQLHFYTAAMGLNFVHTMQICTKKRGLIYIYSEDDKQLNITKPFIATKYCEIITHSNKYISRSIITG